MWRLFTVLGTIVYCAIFAMENSDHVPVSFVVGTPTKIRLVFLLIMAAAGGFVCAYVRGLTHEIALKKQIRKLIDLNRTALARVEVRDEGELDEQLNAH